MLCHTLLNLCPHFAEAHTEPWFHTINLNSDEYCTDNYFFRVPRVLSDICLVLWKAVQYPTPHQVAADSASVE
jgi:hypothetical protein